MQKSICLMAVFAVALPVQADSPFQFQFEEIAPGVWTGVREDAPRFPVMGNTTFVVSDEGVVVFDGGGMPTMSEQLIDKIRSITSAPVTHVVISHWHGDHLFGVYRFAEEYPDVQFVAHRFTRDVINSSRINYIDRQLGYVESNREEFRKIVETGFDSEGNEQTETDRFIYRRILEDEQAIDGDFLRAKVTPPSVVFDDEYTIESGGRTIELRFLGHGNTAGDIVMWLPEEKIVVTGDIVVLPSPYAFNMPPRPWAGTLRAINELDYDLLVPGHGPVQRDRAYINLLIEVADSIADQRDTLVNQGYEGDELAQALDFSEFEERFTGGDEYIRLHYESWFTGPLRAAAVKALTGAPMVDIEPPVTVPFEDDRWQVTATEQSHEEHLGQPALKLRGGVAMLPDVDLTNAMVEFDIAITPDRGFVGLVFRYADEANYENFYIRPHQSGNPDANQYQPVFNGSASWQLYYGPEYAAPVEYRYDQWMTVRIIYAGDQAEVYIDSDEPVLHIARLKHSSKHGAIGVSAGDFAPAHFANFRYTTLANAYRFPASHKEAKTVPGTVTQWEVSDAFDRTALAGVYQLDADFMSARTWTTLPAEPNGITNLAQVARIGDGTNTVFARYTLSSDAPATRLMSFGYSDDAMVFVNGRLAYTGSNLYRSRDYRYLGTIGLFDAVPLSLEAGENEICIAVSEAFGGWGLIARIEAD